MEIEDRTESFTKRMVTPVDRVMAEFTDVYYRLSEVSEILNVSQKTLRRLIKRGETKAPSKQFTRGGMQMYLYTPQDLEELRDYYKDYKRGPDGEDRP